MGKAFIGIAATVLLAGGCDAPVPDPAQVVRYDGPYWHVEDTSAEDLASRCETWGTPEVEHDDIFLLDARLELTCDDDAAARPLRYTASEFHTRLVDRDTYVLTRMVPLGERWRDVVSTQRWAAWTGEDTYAPGWQVRTGGARLDISPLGDPRMPSEGTWDVSYSAKPSWSVCPSVAVTGTVEDIFLDGAERERCDVSGTVRFVPLHAEDRAGPVELARR